jgi:hypothetical protein
VMFTYIDDNRLFILNPVTGEIFMIRMNNKNEPYITKEEILQFEADIIARIKEMNATMVER